MTAVESNDMPEVPRWTLGDRLAKARRAAGVRATEMAELLEVDPGTVSRWERDAKVPKRGTVIAYAMRCNVPLTWLLTGEEGGASTIWYRGFAWSRRVLGLRSEGIRWAS